MAIDDSLRRGYDNTVLARFTKLKVLFLINDLTMGGAEMDLLKLLGRLDRDRFEAVVVSLGGIEPVGRKILELGVPVHALGLRRNRPSLRAFLTLERLLRREKPIILQTCMYHANLMGLAVRFPRRAPRLVWNIPCSDAALQDGSRATQWLAEASSFLASYPDAVVTNTAAGIAVHESLGYHPRRWELIPNGFDLENFKPDVHSRKEVRTELGVPSDALLVGLIGRYHPMKDHETFLKAAGMFARGCPQAHFLLAGRGVSESNNQLRSLIEEASLGSAVHLLGERSDIPKLMCALDIFTSSSAYGEGLANVIGEAMACGASCVVTDVGDAAILVADTGLIVAPKDPNAIFAAWRSLVDLGPEGRKELGDSARRRIRLNYGLDRFVRSYEELYASLSVPSLIGTDSERLSATVRKTASK